MDSTEKVKRAAMLKAQAKAFEAEANELLDSLGDLPIRNYAFGDYILKIEVNRRFDPATAKKNLTAEQYESILKATPNSALAKAVLDDDDYALTQKEYAPKRTIVSVNDLDSEG